MPTASTYREWSEELEQLAASLTSAATTVVSSWDEQTVSGGRLATTLGRSVEACDSNAWTLARKLSFLARECSERAAVCDAFALEYSNWTGQVATWAASDADDRSPLPPREPKPPAPWVDRR